MRSQHVDKAFREKFDELLEFCDDVYEAGIEMLWQVCPNKTGLI